jgi:hypothetical protein
LLQKKGLESYFQKQNFSNNYLEIVVKKLQIGIQHIYYKGRVLNNIQKQKNKLHGLSPRANYTDQVTAACRRSDCQLLRIESATWSA